MAVSAGRRFNVLVRDSFACQYCGAKPPDCVLEVDHIQPTAKHGVDEEWNLVSACKVCNAGKSDLELPVQIQKRFQRGLSRYADFEYISDKWEEITGYDPRPHHSRFIHNQLRYSMAHELERMIDGAYDRVYTRHIQDTWEKTWSPRLRRIFMRELRKYCAFYLVAD